MCSYYQEKNKQKAIVTSYWVIPLMENSISYLLFLSTQIIILIFTQQLLLLRSLCNITSPFCITYPGKVHQLRSCKSQGISPLSHPTDSSSHVPLCLLLLKSPLISKSPEYSPFTSLTICHHSVLPSSSYFFKFSVPYLCLLFVLYQSV